MIRSKIAKLKKMFFPYFFNSSDMHLLLKRKGIIVGKGTIFYSPGQSNIDMTRPCLLEIGEYCKITSGVVILTHDYSRSVLRRVYGDIIGEGRKTNIGDNVFIGMNSVILMGTQIGNNVIIGAGSVVSGSIPDNVVIAGNPAKVIRSLDTHYTLRKNNTIKEAKDYVKLFYDFYGRIPTIKELDPFYPLFLERNIKKILDNKLSFKLGGDEYEEIKRDFLKSKPMYNGYKDFIDSCIYRQL